jgi:hypothetical protein
MTTGRISPGRETSRTCRSVATTEPGGQLRPVAEAVLFQNVYDHTTRPSPGSATSHAGRRRVGRQSRRLRRNPCYPDGIGPLETSRRHCPRSSRPGTASGSQETASGCSPFNPALFCQRVRLPLIGSSWTSARLGKCLLRPRRAALRRGLQRRRMVIDCADHGRGPDLCPSGEPTTASWRPVPKITALTTATRRWALNGITAGLTTATETAPGPREFHRRSWITGG